MKTLKIAGLTRVRNEEGIIQEHLDAMAEYCTAGIYVFDDSSTDRTLEICKAHPAVKSVIGVKEWDKSTDYSTVESGQRQALVQEAQKDNPDWFVYLDADERLFYQFSDLSDEYDVIISRLYDFYITEEDKDRPYNGDLTSMRRLCGPEFRNIVAIFKNKPNIRFTRKDSRNPEVNNYGKRLCSGFIRHYGKAISIENFEKRCNFYTSRTPEYSPIWEKRKGKAIHTESDFGRPLRTWSEVHKYATLLTDKDYTQEQLEAMKLISN